MSRRLFYTDQYAIDLPAGHRFPMPKYRIVRDLLSADGWFEFVVAPLASSETVGLAHDPEYVRRFLAGVLSAQEIRRIGFPWSEHLVQRTLASVGGTLSAMEEALGTGWGGTLAGGTHHAFRGEGSGFCVFNDIAVAIESLRLSARASRIAVIDLDVHQGDGTAQIFADDPSVLTFSMHCETNFPFRKQQSKIDVSVSEGTGDDEYLAQLQAVLPRVFEFRPEFIFYQSGVDGLYADALGKLKLTHEGLKQRDRLVMTAVRATGVPFVVTLGGGYAKPVELTAEAHANTFRVAAAILGA
jgi:acetoin utilization deacetylase AcuC-like enzyme